MKFESSEETVPALYHFWQYSTCYENAAL